MNDSLFYSILPLLNFADLSLKLLFNTSDVSLCNRTLFKNKSNSVNSGWTGWTLRVLKQSTMES
jgi:hypothetical protein